MMISLFFYRHISVCRVNFSMKFYSRNNNRSITFGLAQNFMQPGRELYYDVEPVFKNIKQNHWLCSVARKSGYYGARWQLTGWIKKQF